MFSSFLSSWEIPLFGLEDLGLYPDLVMYLAGFCKCTDQTHGSLLFNKERRAFTELEIPTASTGEASTPPESGEVSSEPRTAFLFMNLPVELRIMIYMSHFNRLDDRKWPPATIGCCLAGDFCPFRRYNHDVPVRRLLMVSRAVYEEAMPLYFRTKTFRFFHHGLSTILSTIGPRHRRHITKLVFLYNVVKTTEDFPLLKDCPALTELTILVDQVPVRWIAGNIMVGLMVLPGLKLLLQIRGIKKLSVIFSESAKEKSTKEEMEGFVKTLQVLKEPYANKRRLQGAAWKLARRS